MLAGATLAMAHESQLEGRLLAILDPDAAAGPDPLRRAGDVGRVLLAIMPLAALQPWTSEAPVQKVNAAVTDVDPSSAERSADRDSSPCVAPPRANRPVGGTAPRLAAGDQCAARPQRPSG